MTTAILAQKLMTVKLDKSEFEKVKWLRKNTSDEQHKVTVSLQQILQRQTKHRTCRLCLQSGGRSIFGDSCVTIVKDIKYVLGIEVNEGDGRPQHICNSCLDLLQKASRLKQTAETTQWRLQQEIALVAESSLMLEEQEPKKAHGGYFTMKRSTVVREWACKKCSRTFQNEEEFREHDQLPSCRRQGKCYVCEVCGRELKSLTLLKRHRMVHTGEPGDFECTHCAYRCRTKYGMQVHERWHTGDRPLQCPTCSRTFSNAANLWTHKQSHLPPKYHCDVCPKSFRYKELLSDHIASVHSSEKPYHCNSCGKAFAIRKKLLRHERNVHNRPRLRVLGEGYSRMLAD